MLIFCQKLITIKSSSTQKRFINALAGFFSNIQQRRYKIDVQIEVGLEPLADIAAQQPSFLVS
jgi:hypothetical protein